MKRPVTTEDYWRQRALRLEMELAAMKCDRTQTLRATYSFLGSAIASLDRHCATLLQDQAVIRSTAENAFTAGMKGLLEAYGVEGEPKDATIFLDGEEAWLTVKETEPDEPRR